MQRIGVLLFVALCWAFSSLLLAVSAAAQDQFDCASFGSQEAAQAELESDPSDPNNLDADNDGVACETYPYSDSGGGGGGRDLDCADFATQEDAQAELDSDPSDPNGLDADIDGVACEDLAGGEGGGGADLDCADFATHGAAQSELAKDPSDPNNLDADDDGIACEDLIGDGSSAAEDQYTTKVPPADVSNPKGVVPGTAVEKKVPDTGGPPIIIGALVLLAGSAVLAWVILRR